MVQLHKGFKRGIRRGRGGGGGGSGASNPPNKQLKTRYIAVLIKILSEFDSFSKLKNIVKS